MASGAPPDYPREPVVAPTAVKQQHYVPQVYLRQFTEATGALCVTDLNGTGRTFRTGTPVVAAEKAFYDFEVDGREVSAEGWLAGLEGAAGPVIRRLVEDPSAVVSLSDAEEEALARFLAAFRFRTPAFRDQLKAVQDQMVAWVKPMARSWLMNTHPHKEAEAIWDAWQEQPDEWWLSNARPGPPAETTALMLEGVQGFANLLRSMPWRIGSLPKERRLYATDNPLAAHLPPVRPWWETGAFPSFRYYVPLSPGVLLQINPWPRTGPPPEGDPGPRERRDFGLWEAELAAKVVSAAAREFAYGDARVVPREQATKWLAQYEQVTVAWAVLVLGHDPLPPEQRRTRSRHGRKTFARLLLDHPDLLRPAAPAFKPEGTEGAAELHLRSVAFAASQRRNALGDLGGLVAASLNCDLPSPARPPIGQACDRSALFLDQVSRR